MAKEPWCGLLPCVGTWRCLAILHHKVWTACWILLSFVPCVHFYQGVFNHHSYQFHENSLHPQPSTPANAARDRVVQRVDSLLCDPRYQWDYLLTSKVFFFGRASKIGNEHELTCNWLVVWNMFYFPYLGNFIIPTDFRIFFRGVGQPPTSSFEIPMLIPIEQLIIQVMQPFYGTI